MANAKAHIFQPIDESGATNERLRAKGIDVIVPEEAWGSAANKRERVEVKLDPGAHIGVGVSNLSKDLTRATLEGPKDLRAISYYTVGYDNVDFDAATEMGILITHSPTEPNWGGVAEGIFAYIMTMLKKVREKDRHVKEGGWRDMSLAGTYIGPRLDGYEGITLGIIGLGRIGGRLADLFQPWRIKILAHDPYVDQSKFVHHNAKPVDLETLLRQSDVVTVHCNLSKETTKLIGEKELALMKPTAILANAARGPIVDVDALFYALDRDQIAGAVLDVLPEEPPDPQSPILGLGDKVLLSPHMITACHGTGLLHAIPWVEDVVEKVLKGEVPDHVVNEDALPKWLERFGGKSLL
ncbi:MAG: dehydrogenase [Rhodospirillales bacterium]|nr:dehydrogenase [Rhodospirillales bacterium]